MGFSETIALEAETLPTEKQAQVLDFIFFLKTRLFPVSIVPPKTADEIETFFRSFKVKFNEYKFDRDDANAR